MKGMDVAALQWTDTCMDSNFLFISCNTSDILDEPIVSTPTRNSDVWGFSQLDSHDSSAQNPPAEAGEDEARFDHFEMLSMEQTSERNSAVPSLFAHDVNTSSESQAESAWEQEVKELFDVDEGFFECDLDEFLDDDFPQLAGDVAETMPENSHESSASLKRRIEEGETDADDEDTREAKRQNTAPPTRGTHMRERKDLNERAREAVPHWAQKVRELREEWEAKRMAEQHAEFEAQVQQCVSRKVRPQRECLLRQLQLSLVEGLILLPDDRPFSSDLSRSFLGWTGFKVAPSRGADFRRKIEDMFVALPQGDTLNNTLRRLGFAPQRGWQEAWNGVGAFIFDATKVKGSQEELV